MSGHSKWSKVKHQKAVEDVKRGQVFSKLIQEISAAAKSNPDPAANPTLKTLVEKARALNMPKENIERAIARLASARLERAKAGGAGRGEEFLLEAFSKDGEGLIIKGQTDNKNRTFSQIRQILARHGAKLVPAGGVLWNFEGDIPKMTKQASHDFRKLFQEIENHPEVTKVLTDAV
ncbi:MAG: YebC/PmpR family DNA-binding transcriptional regulator [Candidatus Colwellbacteria bacterium]|nr:YebC/PmpR family DNA-binding transcriptional regulator [Candidatus Colwellbacteria bacterium]